MSLNNTKMLGYSPWKMKIFEENYKIEETLYTQNLSPTVIYTGTDLTNNTKIAIKELRKSKLKGKLYLNEFAKNEMAIHYSLSRLSNNIVKVPAYFENEESYLMVMEYSNQPNYFEDLLENVYNL